MEGTLPTKQLCAVTWMLVRIGGCLHLSYKLASWYFPDAVHFAW